MGRIKNLLRNINYLSKHALWDQREDDIAYLTDKILDDAKYEYGLDNGSIELEILDKEQSIEAIKNSGKSFVRYSDGEIRLMQGEKQPFQDYHDDLAKILYESLINKNKNILVAINREYYIPNNNLSGKNYNRRHGYDYRMFFGRHCSYDTVYLDATCTFSDNWRHNSNNDSFWNTWKRMFKDKDIVIVCGDHILDKLNYDIFELSKSKEFIFGPKINAWDKHRELISKIETRVSKDKLIVFILGMAGKAMICELADLGYVCWDVGHLAKGYDAYMNNLEDSKENLDKFYSPD